MSHVQFHAFPPDSPIDDFLQNCTIVFMYIYTMHKKQCILILSMSRLAISNSGVFCRFDNHNVYSDSFYQIRGDPCSEGGGKRTQLHVTEWMCCVLHRRVRPTYKTRHC